MAGSFDVFRKYQKQGLAALAILAMVAFFVLPPLLQMGMDRPGGDPVVVSWKGGQMRASEVQEAERMQAAVNRFLMMAESKAFNRQPSGNGVFPEGERSAVRLVMLAREAAANGIVISDQAVNDYIDGYTARRVRSEQLAEIIEQLRPMGLTQQGLFETLRAGLAAQTMMTLLKSGLEGDPPGWRWDFFRRLEQAATVEVVPLPVANFAADVPAPGVSTLRAFFERHRDRLPDEDSPETGFKEPHRVTFEYLVAKQEVFEAEAAKSVTEEQIAEYYEKNKTTRFRKRPVDPEKPGADAAGKAGDGAGQAGDKKTTIEPTTPETKPDDGAKPGSDAGKPDAGKPDAPPQGRTRPGPSATPAAFRRRAADDPAAGSKPSAEPPAAATSAPGEKQPAADASKPQAGPAAATGDKPADEGQKPDPTVNRDGDTSPGAEQKPGSEAAPVDVEPLEKVRDEIRRTLARQAADARIDAIFASVTRDVDGYSTDVALWQARGKASGAAAPKPPDIDLIAAKQQLEAGRGGPLTAVEASRSGPIGESGEVIVDPSSRFGFRRQGWVEMMFGQGVQPLRPALSRDSAGNRYLSWVTANQPEYVPTFEQAKEKVERRWREVEARGKALAKARELAEQAGTKRQALAEVAKAAGLESRTVGPFTWLSQGAVPFGAVPRISTPEGVDRPGEEFMQAVFALEPGGTAAAFNEPQTICYAVRLETFEPTVEQVRDRFAAGRKDQSRLAMVGRQQADRAFFRWFEAYEKRLGIEWRRPPR